MASLIYDKFRLKLADSSTKINLGSGGDTIKVALVTSSYTPVQATNEFFSQVTNEVVGAGYTAGGATLAGQSYVMVGAVGRFDATDTSWATSTITARAAVIYKSTGVAGTSPLIAYIDFGSNKISDGAIFQITWNASGILTIT